MRVVTAYKLRIDDAYAGAQRVAGYRDAQTGEVVKHRPQHLAVARALLEARANPNSKDVCGFTPYHLACDKDIHSALAIARMLHQYGGDPNLRNRFGAVPLIDATQGRQLQSVKTLLNAGADPCAEDLSNAAVTPEERAHPDCEDCRSNHVPSPIAMLGMPKC